jgi:hypothetical protein
MQTYHNEGVAQRTMSPRLQQDAACTEHFPQTDDSSRLSHAPFANFNIFPLFIMTFLYMLKPSRVNSKVATG